ncbi:MAG: DUF481 domain-containing protein [Myxococcota bacterium]
MTDSKKGFAGAGIAAAATFAVALFAAAPSVAHDEPEAPVNEGWIGGISASITAQTGQVDTFAGSIDAVGEQTFGKDWLRGRFNGVYGTSRDRGESDPDDKVIQDAQGLFGDWKRSIHERFFWQSGSELSRNSVQDREVRAALSTGPGYRFWQGAEADLEHFDTNLGFGYRYELYDIDTAPGAPDRGRLDNDHFADLGLGFEYKNGLFQDAVQFTHTGTARMPVNDPAAYVLITEVIFGIPLTPAWSFRTSYYVEYNGVQPARTNNLTTRAAVGLGYTF